MSDVIETISELKIVPVVAIESADDARPLADALTAGGLPIAEITLRTNAGVAAIERLANRDGFLVGAGTVHSVDQAKQVAEAGAAFVVAPGLNPTTVRWCVDNGMPVFPGISSPTDLEMAMELGLKVVKFFPAEQIGGVGMIRALQGPYPEIRFIPTGGINAGNLGEYLALPSVVACGGSWMVKSELFSGGNFEQVTNATQLAVDRL